MPPVCRMPEGLQDDKSQKGFRGKSKRSLQREISRLVEAELAAAQAQSSSDDPEEANPQDCRGSSGVVVPVTLDISDPVACDVSINDLTSDVISDSDESSDTKSNSDICSDDSNVDSSSSDSVVTCPRTSSLGKQEHPLRKSMREWAVLCNVPNLTLYKLLAILKPQLPVLPLHPSTLHLSSGPVVGIQQMGAGEFYYFGFEARLRAMADLKCPSFTFHLSFNVDGLPLFKSSNLEFWPILCLVDGFPFPPFVWAAWCGRGKPPLKEYFCDFIKDMKVLMLHGLQHLGNNYAVRVKCFICDAPASAHIRVIKGHGGYHGCSKCWAPGEYVGKRMTFPSCSDQLRTDESFREGEDKEFHRGKSPLLELNVGLVSSFPLDYMHLVCLGVMKRFLKRLEKTYKNIGWTRKLSDEGLERVNGKILMAAAMWPRDFSRMPRSLQHCKRWTATEFRQFLLYLGPVVLKGTFLKKKYYSLFMLLHYGITLLIRKDLHPHCIDEAESVLRTFVKRCKTVMKTEFMSYNVHNLLHLAADCRNFGPLDSYSAFPFENELQFLKHAVRGRNKPLHQLVRRIQECDRVAVLRQRTSILPDGVMEGKSKKSASSSIFLKAQWLGRTISPVKGDNFVAVDDNVVVVKHFLKKDGKTYVVGKRFMEVCDLYKKPADSSRVGILKVSKLGHALRLWHFSSLKYKLVAVPISDGVFAVFPLSN